MVNEVMELIEGYDSEVGAAIKAECARQRRNLELIASENIVSEPVIPENGIMAAVNVWMWWKHWPLRERKSFLAVITPMFSPIPAHRPIWLSLLQC